MHTRILKFQILTLLWLGSYLLPFLGGLQHPVVEHTAAEEADPCHQAVYHTNLALHCHHASHVDFSRVDVLDHLLPLDVHISVSSFFPFNLSLDQAPLARNPEGKGFPAPQFLSGRAPPIV